MTTSYWHWSIQWLHKGPIAPAVPTPEPEYSCSPHGTEHASPVRFYCPSQILQTFRFVKFNREVSSCVSAWIPYLTEKFVMRRGKLSHQLQAFRNQSAFLWAMARQWVASTGSKAMSFLARPDLCPQKGQLWAIIVRWGPQNPKQKWQQEVPVLGQSRPVVTSVSREWHQLWSFI